MLAEESMNYIFKIIFFTFFSTLFSYQTTTLKGVVLDEENNPINNVYISSKTGYAQTNNDGSFIILYKDKKEMLTFQKIGYKTEIFPIDYLLKSSTIIMKIKNIQLEEIKIFELTGEIKLHESSQDLHVFSTKDLENSNSHFQSIIDKIPNFNFSGATSRPRYFQIRGIGERSQYAGEGGPMYYVGTVIDDIEFSGIGMPIFLDDIKQLEVYQGPQSYAYGHNAMAGLINIKTLDPAPFKENKTKLGIGNGNTINISNYNNIGNLFSGKLLINTFFQAIYQDGFMYNTFLDKHTNSKKEHIEKIKVLFKPNNLFSSKLTFINSNLNNGYDYWSPNNNGDTTYTNQPGKDSQDLIALSIKNKFKVGKIEIIDIANYLNSNLEHSYDADWGNDNFWAQEPYNINYWSYQYYQEELRERIMLSNDLRLINKNIEINPKLNFSNTLGFYYKKLTETDTATGWILGGEDIGLNSEFKINNYALYNAFKISLNKLKITLNGRFEKNILNYKATHDRVDDTDQYNPIYYTTESIINLSNNLIGGRLALLYTLNNKNNIYLSVSNGFKSGGVNQNPTLTGKNQFFEPEDNFNFDFGWRHIDEKISININTFYMYRKNIQLNLSSQLEDANPSSFYFYTANASDGYNYGLNMDLSIIPNKNIETYMTIGFLETMINSYQYMIDNTTILVSKREAAHAPSYTYSFGFTKYYNNFYLSGNITGKDKFYFSDSYNEISEPYSITNIDIGYKMSKNIEISVWGKNIFDKKYSIRGFYFALEPLDLDQNGNPWDDEKLYLMYGEPLTFGLTLKYNIK